MAHPQHLRKFTQCVVASLVLHVLAACDSHTVTLSRYVPSDVNLSGMHALAVAPEDGDVSHDVAHLLRANLQEIEAFETLPGSPSASRSHTQAPNTQTQSALMWAKDKAADGLIVPHLLLGDPQPCLDGSGQTQAEHQGAPENHLCIAVMGTISIIEVMTGRPILFEPVEHVFSWPKDDPADADTHRLQALQDFAHHFCDRLVPHKQETNLTLFSSPSIKESEQAITALTRGDENEAIDLYRTAIARMPTRSTPKWMRARAHFNLGTALAYAGRQEEGLQHLRRAYDLTPDWFFEQQLRDIEAIASGPLTPAPSAHRLWLCRRQDDGTPSCLLNFDI